MPQTFCARNEWKRGTSNTIETKNRHQLNIFFQRNHCVKTFFWVTKSLIRMHVARVISAAQNHNKGFIEFDSI